MKKLRQNNIVKRRILIVDDELISRGYMEMFIQPSPRYEIAASLPRAQDVVDFCRENGILYRPEECFDYLQTLPERYEQMTLPGLL